MLSTNDGATCDHETSVFGAGNVVFCVAVAVVADAATAATASAAARPRNSHFIRGHPLTEFAGAGHWTRAGSVPRDSHAGTATASGRARIRVSRTNRDRR